MREFAKRVRQTIVATLLIGGSVAACGAANVTSGPRTPDASPPVLGLDWGRATSVERPVNFDATLDPSAKVPEHPVLRIPGQALMLDVTAGPHGSLVAVGYVPPDFTAAAWTSADGSTWSLHPIDTDTYSFAVGVAANTDSRIVAVGYAKAEPVAWSSADGARWERHAAPVLVRGTYERMTTVITVQGGFLAGGSAGPELFERHARFWHSADGTTWEAVTDDPAAFDNAEVRSITRLGSELVAVGVVGSAQKPTAGVAWLSSDGSTWTRIDDPDFAGALTDSVVAAPFGGLVAVGSDTGRHEAVVWTSVDGRRWMRLARESSRARDPGYVWMTDVAAVGDVVIATGMAQALQRPSATSWVSHDGVRWERARSAPVQEQGEFNAITPGGPGAVAVGVFGGPDSSVPTVWLTPAR
jgi:hypothetical protein